MAAKLTVKQIAKADQDLTLVFNPMLEGLKSDKYKAEYSKYREAFSRLNELVRVLNETEVTVKG